MNEHEIALNKKMKSTEDELSRLNQDQLSKIEYRFVTEILHQRLNHLKSYLHQPPENVKHEEKEEILKITSKDEGLPSWKIQLALTQRNSDLSLLSLRTISYFLYGLHQLLDNLMTDEHKLPDFLVKFTNETPMTIELIVQQDEVKTTNYTKSFQLFTQLLQQGELNDEIPNYLTELDSQTFGYAKRWISFLVEHHLELSYVFPDSFHIANLVIDQETLNQSLENLKQIRKDTEPFSITGILNGINLFEQKLEILEKDTEKRVQIKSTYSLLKQTRNLLGETIIVEGKSQITENLLNGKLRIVRIMKEIRES